MLKVCIDANIYFSAFAFDGKPSRVVDMGLERQFQIITSAPIIEEARRNLIKKLGMNEKDVLEFCEDILRVANVFEPTGKVQFIPHKQDSLVLETALLGNADVLVTGDKKDLIPLKVFRGISIELPSVFLEQFDKS